MTELPPEMGANFGLTNRTFRKNAAPTGDRSGWTDTPADRERKQKVCVKFLNIGTPTYFTVNTLKLKLRGSTIVVYL